MSDKYARLPFNIKDSGISFSLHKDAEEKIRKVPYQFGFSESGFGESVYFRTYSRLLPNGQQEKWPDTVIRVMNGVFTIRKWWYRVHNLKWDDNKMQDLAYKMAESMIKMHWTPAGRGLWIMGSDFIAERGSMALFNCAFVEVNDLAEDSAWLMDCLTHGVGVGFGISGKEFRLYTPNKRKTVTFEVPDSREGWVESVRRLILSYSVPASPTLKFDYSKIRPYGSILKGFGGTSSGPQPLMELHERIRHFCEESISGVIDSTRLVSDIQNAIGLCVVSGNIRRSAEIAIGSPDDETFLNLKNYSVFPDRESIGWMSNNTVRLSQRDHFDGVLPKISELILENGEPGIFNLINAQKYGRYGDLKPDLATGLNPCFTGDTPVMLANGKSVPIKDLVGKDEFYTFSYDLETRKPVIGRGHSARLTKKEAPIYQVTLYGGAKIRCTGDHRFLLANGTYREAKDLVGGEYLLTVSSYYTESTSLVSYVLECGKEDVYDLTVDKYHNFSVTTQDKNYEFTHGVIVHNCAEISLESYETCNLSEVFPTRCFTKEDFLFAVKAATFYASTVSLYPTHSEKTNEIVARNRRIGVSLSGIAEWIEQRRTNQCIRWMRDAYAEVKTYNAHLASEAGVSPSIRLTTVKPSGTLSQMIGVPSGMHFPTFEYAIRRVIMDRNSPTFKVLEKYKYPYEPLIKSVQTDSVNGCTPYDKYPSRYPETTNVESDTSVVVEFPINQSSARPATSVPLWEQFCGLAMMQREWADNSVSCTIYFNKDKEHKQVNHALSQFAPLVKSVSLLPHSETGAYYQMPYEGISKEEFEKRVSKLTRVNWQDISGSDGEDQKYCTNDSCTI